MKIVGIENMAASPVTMEGASKVDVRKAISGADGAPTFAMRVFAVAPGGHTPFHSHPWEHENYIIEGAGALVTESGEERPLRKGDFCLVLPGEKHRYRNTSKAEPFVFICAVPVANE